MLMDFLHQMKMRVERFQIVTQQTDENRTAIERRSGYADNTIITAYTIASRYV